MRKKLLLPVTLITLVILALVVDLWLTHRNKSVPTSQSTPTQSIRSTPTPKAATNWPATSPQAAAQSVLDLTVSKNWPALYAQLSSEVQGTTSLAQFTQIMSSSSSPVIIASVLDGPGKTSTIGGTTYFAQPVELTVRQTNGQTAQDHATEYFVQEHGSWKLLSTDTPKA